MRSPALPLFSLALVALVALVALPAMPAFADRLAPPDPGPVPSGVGRRASTSSAEVEALIVPPGGGAGARARRIEPPGPVPGLDVATLRAALQATRADLEQCLATSGITGTMRVTARVAVSHALALDIVAPRRDAAAEQCAELVLRRALTHLAAGPVGRAVRASLTVRRRTPRVPRPAPPATGDLAAFEAPVHEAIERDRAAMLSCLSSAAPGVVGEASLRVRLAPDGSLTLASASLPPGVPAGPALPCLSARIANLRFSPAPRRAVTIVHTLPLGL